MSVSALSPRGTKQFRTYGKVLKNVLETDPTIWVLVLVKPHAPRPGAKLNTGKKGERSTGTGPWG